MDFSCRVGKECDVKIKRREIQKSLWIRSKRLEKGLTQQQVADALDLNVRTIRRWEADEDVPAQTNLLRVAKLFGYRLKNIGDTT